MLDKPKGNTPTSNGYAQCLFLSNCRIYNDVWLLDHLQITFTRINSTFLTRCWQAINTLSYLPKNPFSIIVNDFIGSCGKTQEQGLKIKGLKIRLRTSRKLQLLIKEMVFTNGYLLLMLQGGKIKPRLPLKKCTKKCMIVLHLKCPGLMFVELTKLMKFRYALLNFSMPMGSFFLNTTQLILISWWLLIDRQILVLHLKWSPWYFE